MLHNLHLSFFFSAFIVIFFNFGCVDTQAVFSLNGRTFEVSEVPPMQRVQLETAEREYRLKRQEILEDAAIEVYLREHTPKSELSNDAKNNRLASMITEEDLRWFYEQNKKSFNVPYEMARDSLKNQATRLVSDAKREKWLGKIKKDEKLVIFESTPEWENTVDSLPLEGFPSSGNSSGALTVAVFFDYQCGHCRRAHGELKQIEAEFGDRVNFVHLDYPFLSGLSTQLAIGGFCANQQDMLSEYMDQAFAQPMLLNEPAISEFAKASGLRLDAFKECLKSSEAQQALERNLELAAMLGINSTPKLLIDGRIVNIPITVDSLRTELNKRLAAKRS